MQAAFGMEEPTPSQHSALSACHRTMKTAYRRCRDEAATIDRVSGPAGTLLGIAAFALVSAFVLARLVSSLPTTP